MVAGQPVNIQALDSGFLVSTQSVIVKDYVFDYEGLRILYAYCICSCNSKEVIKEQPTPTNLSATARRVLQCTRSQ
jgi:hypothetical protein